MTKKDPNVFNQEDLEIQEIACRIFDYFEELMYISTQGLIVHRRGELREKFGTAVLDLVKAIERNKSGPHK